MFRTEGLQRDAQLHRRIAVDADELVVLQPDDIALIFGNDLSHAHQRARLIGQQYGYGKDPIPLDKAMLYHRGHGDHVHVAAA